MPLLCHEVCLVSNMQIRTMHNSISRDSGSNANVDNEGGVALDGLGIDGLV